MAVIDAGPRRARGNIAGVLFTMASLGPVPLLGLAVAFGGAWSWAALAYLTVFAALLDSLIGAVEAEDGSEFPAAELLSVALAVVQFPLLAAVVWRLGQGLSLAGALPLFLAAGLFIGQIGNANAHELIHRSHRGKRRLGRWVFISVLFGHHASAHPLVHHVHVATQNDPNSARAGEGYYRFLLRAWAGSYVEGFKAERHRSHKMHPYAAYSAGAVLCLALALALGGWLGLSAFLALALFAQAQLIMSDYVQHYGLQRRAQGGKPEPVGEAHSWNAPHVFTSHMMLHAPRHSAHHARPAVRYHDLTLPQPGEAPLLPHSLPVMSLIALVPPLWHWMMLPRLAYWQTVPIVAPAE